LNIILASTTRYLKQQVLQILSQLCVRTRYIAQVGTQNTMSKKVTKFRMTS